MNWFLISLWCGVALACSSWFHETLELGIVYTFGVALGAFVAFITTIYICSPKRDKLT